VDQKKKDELIRRVTSQGQKLPQVPLPAGGYTTKGNPPLPPGRAIAERTASSLTPMERQHLENIGWDDSMPLPIHMADFVAKVQADILSRQHEVILPVDPTKPPAQAGEAIPYDKCSPEHKARLRQVLERMKQNEQLEKEQALDAERMASMPQGVQNAYQMASTPSRAAAEAQVEDDLLGQPQAPQNAPQARPEPATAPAEPPPAATSPTGAQLLNPYCAHCGWDQSLPDVPEPPYAKRLAFLHTVLGQQNFTDEMPLYGGSIVVTFRTLNVPELEVAYAQAFRDRELGRARTDLDFYERINRYRLLMQMTHIRTTVEGKGFVHQLPTGVTAATSPDETHRWDNFDKLPEGEIAVGDTILTRVEAYIVKNVLKTEQLFRNVNSACNQFNRMVSKMEAMSDNTDFWKPTEEQS
jgi:hypothetical protein